MLSLSRPGGIPRIDLLKRALSSGPSPGTPSTSRKPRGAPLALDLDGISLDRASDPGELDTRRKGFTPNLKDLGQTDGHVDQLLSVRLQRRLPQSQRQSQASTPRPQTPRQNTRAPNSRPAAYKPNSVSPRRPGTGGGIQRPKRPSRPARGTGARLDQSEKLEPEVPLTPAELPERRYNLSSLAKLTAPSTSATTGGPAGTSDPVQRLRERVGGDYSKWLSKEDIVAAGKDKEVSAIARARLALAFNPTIPPKDRKRLIATTQTLLNKGRPSAATTSS